jgi:hypothetical protein
MIKPNLIFSHNWHVQPNCQRSLRAFRLSGALLDRGPVSYTRLSSNLLRLLTSRLTAVVSVFARTFQTYRRSEPLSSPHFHFAEAAPTRCWRCLLACEFYVGSTGTELLFSSVAQRKISNIDPTEPLVAHRSFLLGHAMACSLRDSLQGLQGLLPHLTQRTSITTSFPLPSTGQAVQATGRLYRSSATF